MFDKERFENALATSWLGRSFYFFNELDSTNFYAKKMGLNGNAHGALVLADSQTKGRGQYERKWEAEPGSNLTFSLVFTPSKAERLTLLTLSCALAVSEIAQKHTQTEASIKWPNDILAGEKKVAGILTEAQFTGSKLGKVIVGIGFNVNQESFNSGLEGMACSLCQLKNETCDRELILAELLQKIEYYYRLWESQNQDLVKKINRNMLGFGEWLSLEVDGEVLKGEFKFLGVNEKGELLALNQDLDIHSFSYQQVRVKI